MYFTRIRKCHCGFRHASFQAWKSFEFEDNRRLDLSALETGICVRMNMVLESSSPIKKATIKYLQVIAGVKWGRTLKSVLLASDMLYGKSHAVILKRLFHIAFRFGTSCLCCDLVASGLSSVMEESTYLKASSAKCNSVPTVRRMGEKCREETR